MHHINAYLRLTNKLREIAKPMPDLHIINLIIASLPEAYARARSNWSLVPEAERTISRLTSHLKAEEVIIKSYGKTTPDVALIANNPPGPAPHRSHDRQEDHNSGDGYDREAKRGRRGGRGGRGRGGRGASNVPPTITEPSTSSQPSDPCLWCPHPQRNSHKTADCFSMARAKKARQDAFIKSEHK